MLKPCIALICQEYTLLMQHTRVLDLEKKRRRNEGSGWPSGYWDLLLSERSQVLSQPTASVYPSKAVYPLQMSFSKTLNLVLLTCCHSNWQLHIFKRKNIQTWELAKYFFFLPFILQSKQSVLILYITKVTASSSVYMWMPVALLDVVLCLTCLIKEFIKYQPLSTKYNHSHSELRRKTNSNISPKAIGRCCLSWPIFIWLL